jgi:hypothetical protein
MNTVQKSLKLVGVRNEDKVSKTGKPYVAAGIKIIDNSGNEVWINGFGNEQTKQWQKDDIVLVELFEEEYNGEVKWKFKPVSIETQFRTLKTEVEMLKGLVHGLLSGKKTEQIAEPEPAPLPSFTPQNTDDNKEISVEDIPF